MIKNMNFGFCGNSGLQLSAISLGLWHNFGDIDDFSVAKDIIFSANTHWNWLIISTEKIVLFVRKSPEISKLIDSAGFDRIMVPLHKKKL